MSGCDQPQKPLNRKQTRELKRQRKMSEAATFGGHSSSGSSASPKKKVTKCVAWWEQRRLNQTPGPNKEQQHRAQTQSSNRVRKTLHYPPASVPGTVNPVLGIGRCNEVAAVTNQLRKISVQDLLRLPNNDDLSATSVSSDSAATPSPDTDSSFFACANGADTLPPVSMDICFTFDERLLEEQLENNSNLQPKNATTNASLDHSKMCQENEAVDSGPSTNGAKPVNNVPMGAAVADVVYSAATPYNSQPHSDVSVNGGDAVDSTGAQLPAYCSCQRQFSVVDSTDAVHDAAANFGSGTGVDDHTNGPPTSAGNGFSPNNAFPHHFQDAAGNVFSYHHQYSGTSVEEQRPTMFAPPAGNVFNHNSAFPQQFQNAPGNVFNYHQYRSGTSAEGQTNGSPMMFPSDMQHVYLPPQVLNSAHGELYNPNPVIGRNGDQVVSAIRYIYVAVIVCPPPLPREFVVAGPPHRPLVVWVPFPVHVMGVLPDIPPVPMPTQPPFPLL